MRGSSFFSHFLERSSYVEALFQAYVVSIAAFLFERAQSFSSALAELVFVFGEQLARHSRAVLKRETFSANLRGSEKNGRDDHDILFVLQERVIDRGQLVVKIRYVSLGSIDRTGRPHVHVRH